MNIDPATRYRRLVSDLVAAANRRDTALAAAQQSHAVGVEALAHDLSAAQQSADRAAQRAGTAQRVVAGTDLAAVALWDELKRSRGRRGRRLGVLPGPMADPAAGQAAVDPEALLAAASARVARATRGGEPLPLPMLPLLFLAGAAAAALVALLAAALSWILLAVAPLAGLLPARWWVDQRYAARLDPGAMGLVALGGMLATALVWTSLR